MSKVHRASLMLSCFDLHRYIPTGLLKLVDTILTNSKRQNVQCIRVGATTQPKCIVLRKIKHEQIPIKVVEFL